MRHYRFYLAAILLMAFTVPTWAQNLEVVRASVDRRVDIGWVELCDVDGKLFDGKAPATVDIATDANGWNRHDNPNMTATRTSNNCYRYAVSSALRQAFMSPGEPNHGWGDPISYSLLTDETNPVWAKYGFYATSWLFKGLLNRTTQQNAFIVTSSGGAGLCLAFYQDGTFNPFCGNSPLPNLPSPGSNLPNVTAFGQTQNEIYIKASYIASSDAMIGMAWDYWSLQQAWAEYPADAFSFFRRDTSKYAIHRDNPYLINYIRQLGIPDGTCVGNGYTLRDGQTWLQIGEFYNPDRFYQLPEAERRRVVIRRQAGQSLTYVSLKVENGRLSSECGSTLYPGDSNEPTQPFGVPTLVSPADGATGVETKPLLDVSDVADASSYRFQISTVQDFSTFTEAASVTSQLQVTGELQLNTKYYWRARAEKADGTASSWSAVRSFTTRDPGQQAVTVPRHEAPHDGATGLDTTVTIDWRSVANAASYDLQISTSVDMSNPTEVGGITATLFQVTGLEFGTTYYWRVRARNAGGVSSWSPQWQFATRGVPTSTETGEMPVEFALHQNYPNPFNPSTTVGFDLPISADVHLAVYNVLGQEVEVLTSGHKPAGKHMVTFNAEGLATGLYLFRLQAGDFVATRKMLLKK